MHSVISRVLHMAEATLEGTAPLEESGQGKVIAQTIVRQLKALDKWALASWGAAEFVALEDGVQFRVKGSNVKTGGRVQVRLNGGDTYDIRLIRVRGVNIKEIGAADNIHVEELVDILDGLIG